MPKAFVHIGLPKTGSTAIQLDLKENRAHIRSEGLLYPGFGEDHTLLISRFHKPRENHMYFVTRGLSPDEVIRHTDELLVDIRYAAESFAGDIVLSSEYFAELDFVEHRKMNSVLRDMGYEPVCVAYVRHPIAAATSQIQQNIKMGFGTLSDYLENPIWHPIESTLKHAMTAFGRENMIVRSFEAAHATGVERDFLRAIGHEKAMSGTRQAMRNNSLSLAGVFLAEAHNRLVVENPHIDNLRWYLENIGGPKFFLPRATRDCIREASKGELSWLAENFELSLEEPIYAEDHFDPGMLTPDVAKSIIVQILGQTVGLKL